MDAALQASDGTEWRVPERVPERPPGHGEETTVAEATAISSFLALTAWRLSWKGPKLMSPVAQALADTLGREVHLAHRTLDASEEGLRRRCEGLHRL